ncbi:MAG: putative rane protein [Nocardioides sp.]|jgi:hypothetical protein|nr:putative rane protein [Nocardioides sp.]
MSCEFAHHDGSYVLGALSPTERQEFEGHLADCVGCARSVRELAGLPGLLGRVGADVLVSPAAPEPVPDTLLPALVREVRRSRRRRAWTTAGLAAASVAAIAAVSVAAAGALTDDDGGPVADPAPSVPTSSAPTTAPTVRPGQPVSPSIMVPVGNAPVRATVSFSRVDWGTRLDLVCTYAPLGGEYGTPQPTTYALVVRTRDGRLEQVATWRALPGRTMRLSGATSLTRREIASVQVRTADGHPVLQLRA